MIEIYTPTSDIINGYRVFYLITEGCCFRVSFKNSRCIYTISVPQIYPRIPLQAITTSSLLKIIEILEK